MLTDKELNSNFQQVLGSVLVEGEDYNKQHFLSKPYLSKAGAEKICRILELKVNYKVMKEVYNYEQNLITFKVRCILKKDDKIVTKGIGRCTVDIRKYNKKKCSIIAKRKALTNAVLKILDLNNIFIA